MTDPDQLPEAAIRRLGDKAGASALSVPDYAACLQMGMRPVGLVQGFCVMQWSFYGAGSPYMRGTNPFGNARGYQETYQCPHGGFAYSAEHRTWGQNYEQPWIETAWATGFNSAYDRMLEEASALGAHGVIGVVDVWRNLADTGTVEFHIYGTAVVIDDGPAPADSTPWTSYLAGQRLGKVIEAGFMPVAIVAALVSVRVWAYCMTEYLMEGGTAFGAYQPQKVDQIVSARMAVRRLCRERIRAQLGPDAIQGAKIDVIKRQLAQGDEVIDGVMRGNRVRRFGDFAELEVPRPTVSLA